MSGKDGGVAISDDNEIVGLAQSSTDLAEAVAKECGFARRDVSNIADKLVKVVSGQDTITLLAGVSNQKIKKTPQGIPYIPASISAQYRLTDYFLASEGDVWQTIELPLELSATELVYHGEDDGTIKEVQDAFAPENLDMYQFMLDMDLCMEQYGVSYPFQIWEGSVPSHLSLLNPRYMAVGELENFGQRPLWLSSAYGVDERTLTHTLPEPIRNALTAGRNGKVNSIDMFELSPDVCTQVSDKKLPWQAYPLSPLTRCFRNLSTRQTLEEMVRATIEGIKNQLWLFLLGDAEHPPNPAEIRALTSAISGQTGDRTGWLVWKGNLKVEQHTPKSVDALLGNEFYLNLTKHIMRQRGISLRLIDGEVKQAEQAPSPLDIRVLLQRLQYRRGRIERWSNGFIRKYARVNKMKEKNVPTVGFLPINLETEERIRSILTPMLTAGAISMTTYHEQAQVSTYETELERKKKEQKDADMFLPKPSFSQTTVNPNTLPKRSDHTTPGRPPDDGTKPPAKEPEVEGSYHDELLEAYKTLRSNRDTQTFGVSLKEIGSRYLADAYKRGYDDAGGARGVDEDRIAALNAWHVGFVDGFVEDVSGAIANNAEDKLERWQNQRLSLYASGERMAFISGVMQARREQNYTGWRRVCAEGACDVCREDSKVIHSIGEEFYESHIGGKCSQDFISFFRGPISTTPWVLPRLPDMPIAPSVAM